MKNTLTLTITAMLLTTAVACSSSGTGTGKVHPSAPGATALQAAEGTTEITIWHGLGAANGKAFTKLIDQFNAANTGKIHVTAAYQGVYADLLAKYSAALRDGSAPTVMLAGDIATAYMIDVGRSIPASDMAAANPDDLHLDDLAPAARNYYSVDHVQQAVPMNVSTPMLWVNREVLRSAGLEGSRLKTLDDVVAAATTVKQKTGRTGFTMQTDDWYIEQLVATAGQDFCAPDNGRSGKRANSIIETYLTSPQAQEEFSHATGYIPINTKTADSPTQKAYLEANPNARAFANQLANTPVTTATSGCVSGAMTSIKASNISQLQAAFAGGKSVDDALATAANDAEKAFQQYQEQLGK